MPGWAWVAYAIGVGVGTLGAIGLLLRKWWAPLAFALSLIAVLVQFSYPFLFAPAGAGRHGDAGFSHFHRRDGDHPMAVEPRMATQGLADLTQEER